MKKYHFLVVGVILLLLSIIAFSDNLFWDINQESNSDPKFIIHGLFCFAWFIFFVVQANFIKKGDYKAHIKWGVAGMFSAIGVFISTVYVFVVTYKSWDLMPFWIKANRFLMLGFGVLVLLGYLNRKNGPSHKRYLYMATLYMLEPVIGRVGGHIGLADGQFDLFEGAIWNALFITLFVYDWKTLGRIHPVSWIGVVVFYLIWAAALLV